MMIEAHCGLCWFDFLKMFGQLFFAIECSEALWTLISNVLNSLRLFVGRCFLLLGH